MKKAYVFPGQGSQYIGMGLEEFNSSPVAKEMYLTANAILGFDITEIMFHGSDEQLRETRVTQPAVFLDSVIKAACLSDFAPDMVAGHSLGEMSALTAAGVLSFEDGLRLVAARAQAMQKCCEAVPGTMAAIIALPTEEVERICSETPGIVVAANYNCEGQIVISGEKQAVEDACNAMKAAGAKRALPLSVSGAFHSPLMEPARADLAQAIEATLFRTPQCPVYQNVSASGETEPETIKANLLRQLTSPVRWTQSVRKMVADGATTFIEVGPGSVLQGLVSRIAKADGLSLEILSASL